MHRHLLAPAAGHLAGITPGALAALAVIAAILVVAVVAAVARRPH